MNITPPYNPSISSEQILTSKSHSLCQEAVQYLDKGEFSKALELLNEAMYTYPNVQNLQYLRALCLWQLMRMDEAVIAVTAELKAFPQNINCLFAASIGSAMLGPYVSHPSANMPVNKINQQLSIRSRELKVHSQFGEDGILAYIFSQIGTTNRKFVEIGIGSGSECNTANLAINMGWSGLLMDGNLQGVEAGRYFYRNRSDINVVHCFVTVENINQILTENGLTGEIDLFSLDIDGNDYWIWQEIDVVHPRVLVAEYNPCFGPDRSITIKYSPNFNRFDIHGHYHGASITALTKLFKKKGYILIGCGANGFNAFFMREEVSAGKFIEILPAQAYQRGNSYNRAGSIYDQFEEIRNFEYVEV